MNNYEFEEEDTKLFRSALQEVEKIMDRIEDKIFADALKTKKLRRTQSMYEKDCRYPHKCTICLEQIEKPSFIFKLKSEFITDDNTPYLFICSDCYNELPND